ncbi:(d)CMP kinase [Barrientosiimonas marina]|uniref:Cytidylate kinase n=1 Tax=Lentibacillus kimchii TaxID=1542911 RepID=A0ABW2UWD9_9BACI
MENDTIAIAIDGPAAAGKSTVSKIVANKLSFIYIDTGAMYRALTLKALRRQVSLEDEEMTSQLLSETSIELEQDHDHQHVFVDGEDVTDAIRSENVTNNVSSIAKQASVRQEMVERQQELAQKRGVVMDGRDIGTHVIPDAEVKIFLRASVEERAKRRYQENIQKGFSVDFERLKQDIEQRDTIDSKRDASPLIKAEDAISLDTTDLSINDVAAAILQEAGKVLADNGAAQ